MQIRTKALTKVFDEKIVTRHVAIEDVSVTFSQGEFVTVIGRTGSGKTTFIEHLNALQIPTSGNVIIGDEINYLKVLKSTLEFISKFPKAIKPKEKNIVLNEFNELTVEIVLKQLKRIKKQDEANALKHIEEFTKASSGVKDIHASKKKIKDIKAIRKRVGVVFQFAEYQLFEETIEKDIIFGPVTMGTDKEEAKKQAAKYLKMVGLDESFLQRSPFALSGGQKRRVALAGILAMEPDFLIFDEPTAGLDPHGEVEMYDIFNKLHKSGKTIIIVTHNLDHVLSHSHRTIMFNASKLVADTETVKLMYDKHLLESNELEAPKLTQLVWELEAKGKKIGKVRSIDELVKKL